MPLSADEKHLVYEILDIPNQTSVLHVNADWGTGSRFRNLAILSSKTEIDTLLNALPAEIESRVRTLTVSWDEVALETTKLKPLGANEGVDVSPARTRSRIKKLLRVALGIHVDEQAIPGGGGIALA